jgi:hypothetical protein
LAQAAEIASDVAAYLFLGRSEVRNLVDIGAGKSDHRHLRQTAITTQPSQQKKNAAAPLRAFIRSHLQAAQQQVSSHRGVICEKWGGEMARVTPPSACMKPFSLAPRWGITCFGQLSSSAIPEHCFVKKAETIFIVSAPIVPTSDRCSKLSVRSQIHPSVCADYFFKVVNNIRA